MLLQTRLTHECKNGQTELLQDQMKVIVAGSDYSSLELLRLKFFAPVRIIFNIYQTISIHVHV